MGTFIRDGVELSALGRNAFVPECRQFVKLTDIPNPAQMFVFLDEHPDSIDDTIFMVDPGYGGAESDLPGSYHNGAGDFTYADGHSALHQWRSSQTVLSVAYQGERRWHPTDPVGQDEHKWLADRAAVPDAAR